MTGSAWMERAACAGMSTFLDFTADKPDEYERDAAVKVCGYCAVRAQCLEFGQSEQKRHGAVGVYGGQVFRGRGDVDPAERDRTVADLFRQGFTDEAIGARLDLHYSRVRDIRRRLGLITYRPCGTRSAYRRHERNGEAPCQPCRDAENDYRRRIRSTA